MRKSLKILLVVILCVAAAAGAGLGAYFLLGNRNNQLPPRYTPVVQSFIDQLQSSTGKLNARTEDVVLPISTGVNVADIVSVSDKYLVVNYGSRQQIITRGDNVSLLTFSDDFDTVISISGDYALVKLGESGAPFVLNLLTRDKICDVTFDPYYDDNIGVDKTGYAFVKDYLVVSSNIGDDDCVYDCEAMFSVRVYYLKTGACVKNFVSGYSLSSGDFVLAYSVSEKYLAIRTLEFSAVYDLTSNSIGSPIVSYTNEFNSVTPQKDNENTGYSYAYTHDFGDDRIYDLRYQHMLTVYDNGYVLVSKISQPDLPQDVQYKETVYLPGACIDGANGRSRQKGYSQTVSYYDIARRSTTQLSGVSGYYVEPKVSTIDGFVLLLQTKIGATGQLKNNEKIATYRQMSNLQVAFSYDYSNYGDVVAFHDDRIVCCGDGLTRPATVLNPNGEVLFTFGSGVYSDSTKACYGKYFVARTVDGCFIADVYGNTYCNGENWTNITPVVDNYAIAKFNGTNYLINVLDQNYTKELSTYSQDGVVLDYAFSNNYGLNFYVENSSGNYSLYSFDGTEIQSNVSSTNLRILTTPTGVTAVYKNSQDKVKALVFENKSLENDKTIAFVNSRQMVSINPKIAVAEDVTANFVADTSTIQSGLGFDIYNGNVSVLQDTNGTSLNALIYQKFQESGDMLGRVGGVPQAKLIVEELNNVFPFAGGSVNVTYSFKIYARFKNVTYQSNTYSWASGGANSWANQIPEHELENCSFQYDVWSVMEMDCSEGYYFSFSNTPVPTTEYLLDNRVSGNKTSCYFDLWDKNRAGSLLLVSPFINLPSKSTVDYEDFSDESLSSAQNDCYYIYSQPNSEIQRRITHTTQTNILDVDSRNDNNVFSDFDRECYYQFEFNFTIAPVQYGNSMICLLSSLGNYNSVLEQINGNGSYRLGVLNITAESNGQYVISADNGVLFRICDVNAGYSNSWSSRVEFPKRLGLPQRIEIVEAFTDLSFFDYSVNADAEPDSAADEKYIETNLLVEASENNNSGANGSVQFFDIENNSALTMAKLRELFNIGTTGARNGYYRIYSGGTDGNGQFAGNTYGGGSFGIVNNVKATQFPFKFVKAGHYLDDLAISPSAEYLTSLFDDSNLFSNTTINEFISKFNNTLSPIYLRNAFGILNLNTIADPTSTPLETQDVFSMIIEQNGDDVEASEKRLTDIHGDKFFLINPVYQLFRANSNIENAYNVEDSAYNLPFRYNDRATSRLYATWTQRPYQLYFYDEQDVFEDINLVGGNDDWYFAAIDENGNHLINTDPSQTGQQLYTFDSEIYYGFSGSDKDCLPINALGKKTGENKERIYGATLTGLPIPVKNGYRFVGWRPMVLSVDGSGNETLNYLYPDSDPTWSDYLIREGSRLLYNNCDVNTISTSLFFKAVWEAKTIQLAVNIGDAGEFLTDGITDFSTNINRYNYNGWSGSVDNGCVTFTTLVSFDELKNAGKHTLSMPVPIDTRWKTINYMTTIADGTEVMYLPLQQEEYVVGGQEHSGKYQANYDVQAAQELNLAKLFLSINNGVKENEYMNDSITLDRNDKWCIETGYNIPSYSAGSDYEPLTLSAIPINVDSFVNVSVNNSTGTGISYSGEYNGKVSGGFNVTESNNNSIVSFLGRGGVNLSNISINNEYRFDSLTLRVYVGGESERLASGSSNKLNYVDVKYIFDWKNNQYFGTRIDQISPSSLLQGLSNEELLNLVLEKLDLANRAELESLVTLNSGEVGINLENKVITAGTDNITDGYLRKIRSIVGGVEYGDILSLERRAFDLKFEVKTVEYNVVMAAFEQTGSTTVDQTLISQVAAFGIEGTDGTAGGASGILGVGEIKFGNFSTRNSNVTIDGQTKKGYAITTIGRKEQKTLSIVCGGENQATGGDIYSHFLATFVVANLVNAQSGYGVETDGFEKIDLDILVTYYADGSGMIIRLLMGGNEYVLFDASSAATQGAERQITVGNGILFLQVVNFDEDTNTFDFNVRYVINPDTEGNTNTNTNDILVVAWFKKYEYEDATQSRGGDYTLIESYDGVQTNTESDVFSAIKKTEVTLNNKPGYYLKSLTIRNMGNDQTVINGVPIYNGNIGLTYRYYVTSNLNSNKRLVGSLINVGSGEFTLNNSGYFEFANPYVPKISLYGLYNKVEIVAEFESVSLFTVINPIVQFEETNVNSLDYNFTFNTNSGSKNLKGYSTFVPYDGQTALSRENVYYLSSLSEVSGEVNEFVTAYLFVGQGINTATFNIDGAYTDFESVSRVNPDDSGVNNTENIDAKTNNNTVVVTLKKETYILTITIALGYDATQWISYTESDYYNSNQYEKYNELINARLGNFKIGYYGIYNNPTIEDDSSTFNNLTDYTFKLTCFKKKDVKISFDLLSDHYSNTIEVRRTPKNGAVQTTDLPLADGITLSANDATVDTALMIRVKAEKYNITYLSNEPEGIPADEEYHKDRVWFSIGGYMAILNDGVGELDDEIGEAEHTIENIAFDSIVQGDQYLNGNVLMLKGYTFLGWSNDAENINEDNKLKTSIPFDERYVSDETEAGTTISFYAHWEPSKIKIVFNKNDNSGSVKYGSTAAEFSGWTMEHEYTFNDLFGEYMPDNNDPDNPTIKRVGYMFRGWSDSAGTYENQRNIFYPYDYVNFELGENQNHYNLYAVWEPVKYRVYYNKALYDYRGQPFVGSDQVQRFDLSNLLDGYHYDEVRDRVYQEIKFDSRFITGNATADHPIITLTGYDFKGWFIDLRNTQMTNVSEQNEMQEDDVNWAVLGGESYLKGEIVSAYLQEPENYVNIYPKWERQGVPVRLVTKTTEESDDDIAILNRLSVLASGSEVITMLGDYSLTPLNWLKYDVNGATNGVHTDPRITRPTGITYDIQIPYYEAAGTNLGYNVPTADGYVFSGYYYYSEEDNSFVQYITSNEDGQMELSQIWDKEWDRINPIKLYAQWTIKTYTVNLTVPSGYSRLMLNSDNTQGVFEEGSTAYLSSFLKVRLSRYSVDENGNEATTPTAVQEIAGSTDGSPISIGYLFYERVIIDITMPTGHYLKKITCNDFQYEANWNKEGHSSSFNYGTNNVDGIQLVEDLNYRGKDSNADISYKYKRDVTGTVAHIFKDYNITLDFGIQKYNVKVEIIKVKEDGARIVGGPTENAYEEQDLDFGSRFSISNNLPTIPFYACDNKLYERYENANDNTPFDYGISYIYENVTLYVLYQQTRNERHEGFFYGLNSTGTAYEKIQTNNDYLYAISNARWGEVINGTTIDPTTGRVYTFTNCLGVGGVILKTPVPTSFYWPNEVDGYGTRIRFAYWVKWTRTVNNVWTPPSGVLTAYSLSRNYISGSDYEIVDVGRSKMTDHAKYYAVFDTEAKGIRLEGYNVGAASANDRSEYFIAAEDNNYVKYSYRIKSTNGTDTDAKIDVKSIRLTGTAVAFAKGEFKENENGSRPQTADNYIITIDLTDASVRALLRAGDYTLKVHIETSTNITYESEITISIVDNHSYCSAFVEGDEEISDENLLDGGFYTVIDGTRYNGAYLRVCITHSGVNYEFDASESCEGFGQFGVEYRFTASHSNGIYIFEGIFGADRHKITFTKRWNNNQRVFDHYEYNPETEQQVPVYIYIDEVTYTITHICTNSGCDHNY